MKNSFTYYYVQAQKENGEHEIVPHSQDDETEEIYYKFFDKSKAKKLAESQKKIDTDVNFRIVKLVETYEVGAWF